MKGDKLLRILTLLGQETISLQSIHVPLEFHDKQIELKVRTIPKMPAPLILGLGAVRQLGLQIDFENVLYYFKSNPTLRYHFTLPASEKEVTVTHTEKEG